MNEVEVEWLREAARVLLDHLEDTQGPRVRVERDMYWSIPPEAVYEVTTKPTDLTIGSLSDERQFVESMLRDDTVLNYGLVWLGELFRAVGEQAKEE